MKSYTQLMEELRAPVADDTSEVNEQTVHLVPHGDKGTHFKVVKGIKGQLDAGEVIHDSHVDDLHDIGIKTKILKEDEMSEEELMVFEGEDVTEGEQLDEWSDPETLEAGRKLAAQDTPRTEDEEKKIARGQLHGDYKGHAAAMRKKHNIT